MQIEINADNSSELLKKEGSFNPDEKAWKISIQDTKTNETKIIVTNHVSIASGHHGTPVYPTFPGLETFKGDFKLFFGTIELKN